MNKGSTKVGRPKAESSSSSDEGSGGEGGGGAGEPATATQALKLAMEPGGASPLF